MKKTVKKYQDGGKTGRKTGTNKNEGAAMKAKGQAMKAKGQAMKSEGQAMKALGKASISPATGMYDELDTRQRAAAIKARETGDVFVRGTGTGSQNRTVAEQKILDKDMAIIRAKEAQAKIKSQKESAAKTAERKTVANMQAKGGYKGKMKTGGMVNSNAKVSALKSAGSKGVKSGVNPRAAASKVARGKVGGISSAPKTAVPKAKYGMSMRKK
jgi:hypothetical protein